MFTSLMGLPRLAPAMLSGMVLLVLSGAPSPAQVPGQRAPQLATGQAVATIAPAVTVVSTVHYQAHLNLNCNAGNSCSGSFPKPGAGRRLNLTRITCFVYGPTGTSFKSGYAALMHPEKGLLLYQWLPADYSSPGGIHTLNRAVDVQVAAREFIFVGMNVESGTLTQAICSGTGTLDTLG